MGVTNCRRVALAALLAWLPVRAQVLSPEVHPSPTGIQGVLYADAAQIGRAASVTSINQLVGFKNRLFVALNDSAGHEILDVWDTRNLSRPVLVSSLDFGSVLTNGVMFTPLALVPFDGGLLLQTRTGLAIYRFQPNGQLAFDETLPSPGTGLGQALGQLHVAGRHGSMLQQVIPNNQITAQNMNQVHQEVLFDLANPERPKLLWAGSDGPSVMNAAPINSLFGGNPASLSFEATTNHIWMAMYESTRKAQRDTFWMPKLRALFAASALERPLKDLLQEALSATDLADLQGRGVRVFAQSNGPAATLLTASILDHHVGTRQLKDVFAQYGIAVDDPLEMALAKVIAGHLDADLEARLGQEWYAPALQSWLDTILAPGINLNTAAETKAAVAAVFNAEIDEHTLARYLTLHVISPLIGNPDFMELTLGQVLDQLTHSRAGEMIDVVLRTAGGYGTVNAALDAIRSLLNWLPFVDIPSLPSCAQFPDSTEKLINLALFSWNDAGSGLTLDREGLAWFELLKFYRYLCGHTDFPDYTAQINQRLRTMQQTLGGNLAGRLSDAFTLPDVAGELSVLQAQVAGERQARLLIGRLMANAVVELLPADDSFTATMSTRTALAKWGLRVQQLGYSESKVSDLIAAMQSHGLAQTTVGDAFQHAEVLPGALFQAQVEQVLRQQVQTSFHLGDLDASLLDLLTPCLEFDVGVQDVLGDWMGDLLNDLLTDGPGMSSLLLEYRRAFENHDCLARWLVTLDAISAVAAIFGAEAAPRALEYALSEGYSALVGYAVNTMFGRLIGEVLGSFGGEPKWLAAQLSSSARDWTIIEPIPNATTTTLGVFAWQQRVGAVVQQRFETNWFGPRSLKLVLCHPDDPSGTRRVYDLGRWQTVNYVNHHAGALFVGGSYFTPTDTTIPSGKALVVDLDVAEPQVQRLQGDAHLLLASAPKLAGANHNASLAVGGVNRVFFIPNPAGAVTSQSQTSQPPHILRPPVSGEVPTGGSHVFTVRASGTAPLSYQWLKDGSPIVGASQTRLEIVANDDTTGGQYSVIVSNSAGTETANATLTVLSSNALRIVQQPTDVTKLLGQSATFTVGAESTGTPTYQWFHGGSTVASATRTQLVLTNVSWADAGDYHVEVRQGSATLRSRAATLDLVEASAPGLVSVPAAQQPLGLGAAGTLTSTAVGWGDLTYQWYKDGQPVAGGTTATLELGTVTTNSLGEYRLEVHDEAGNISSYTFTVVLVASASMSGHLNSSGQFEVNIANGVTGQTYSLQRSTNLIHWSEVQSGSFQEFGTAQYEDSTPAATTTGTYFRLRVAP